MLTAEKSITPNPARALYENFMTGEYGKKWDDLPAGVQKRWADALAAGVIAMTSVRIEPVEDFDTEALRAASLQPGTIAVLPEPTDIIFSDGEPYAAMTVDYLGCEYLSRDVENIEKIAAAGSKGPTEVIYLFRGTRSKSLWPKQSASIMALEWHTFCSRSGNCAAQSPVGEYVIQNEDDLWLVYLPYQDKRWGKGHSTIEEAKAAAQADYETRIRSALSAQVQDVAAKSLADVYQKYLDAVNLYNERHAIMKTKALGTMRVDEEYKAIDEARRAFDKLAVDIAKSALPVAPAKQEGDE